MKAGPDETRTPRPGWRCGIPRRGERRNRWLRLDPVAADHAELQPASRWCYVLAGPDLRESADNPSPSHGAPLWLHALQLEQAEKPSPFGPRTPVEFGLLTDRLGNVFALDEPLWIRVALANADSRICPAGAG